MDFERRVFSVFSISQYNIWSADSVCPMAIAPVDLESIWPALMFPNVTLLVACMFSLTVMVDGAVHAFTFILSLTGSTAGSAVLFGLFAYLAMFLATGLLDAFGFMGSVWTPPPSDLFSWWDRMMYVPVTISFAKCVTGPIPPVIPDARLPGPPPVSDPDVKVLLADLDDALNGLSTPELPRSATPSVVPSEDEIPAKPARRSHLVLFQNSPGTQPPKRP